MGGEIGAGGVQAGSSRILGVRVDELGLTGPGGVLGMADGRQSSNLTGIPIEMECDAG